MKYYLIAGEASGDLHAANLMKEIKSLDADAQFRYFGGDKMEAQGGTLVKHYKEMSYMGLIEVISHLRVILKNVKQCKNDIMAFNPDVVILVDFPGFNLRIAEFTKSKGFKTFYYIAPKVWAWNTKRVYKIKKVIDALFCILPFEVEFFKKFDIDAHYVGNPILDELAQFTPDDNFLDAHNWTDKKIIALLPGSREQEIKLILPEMAKVVTQFKDYQFVVAASNNFDKGFYQKYMGNAQIPLVFNQAYDLLIHADAALVASGTATLETALLKIPQVVLYKGNPITVKIGRMVIKIKYLSLVNLILNSSLVKELIQEDCNNLQITNNLKEILSEEGKRRIQKGYFEIAKEMGGAGASRKAAQKIWGLLTNP